MEAVFRQLIEFEKENSPSIAIDDQHVMTYLYNTPEYDVIVDEPMRRDGNETLYVIPRHGDLLLSVDIDGADLEHVSIFQYDAMGSQRIVYEQASATNSVRFAPFPASGFPLLQCGKSVYVLVRHRGSGDTATIICRFTLLDGVSRKRLFATVDEENHGVKIRHRDGSLYQVFNMLEHGYSPNVLAPVN